MEKVKECINKKCKAYNKEYCHNCELNNIMLNEGTNKLDFCNEYLAYRNKKLHKLANNLSANRLSVV